MRNGGVRVRQVGGDERRRPPGRPLLAIFRRVFSHQGRIPPRLVLFDIDGCWRGRSSASSARADRTTGRAHVGRARRAATRVSGDVREVFLRARLRSRGVRRFGAVPRAGRARDRARRASFGGGVDSVPPTVVEDGGTRGPASRPRAAVRSFPSPRVRLFGRRARGPRRLGRVARVRRRRLGARERAPSPRRRVSHAGGGRGGLGARARAGALPSRRDRPDVSAPRASPSHTAPRVRLDVDVLDDAARVRLSIAATEDAVPRGARDKTRSRLRWRATTTIPPRARGATPPRESASRASTPPEPPSPKTNSFPPAASTRLAPPPRTPAGMRAFLLGEDSFEDVGRANRYPELAGVRSTVPPFPSTTARKRRASRGETRPGVYEPSATSTSARAVAMSEVDASVALARVVAEALLRPTNTLNGYDLSGWPDQTSTPVVERDEESATATTMAAESAAVDALAAAAGNLARSIATRLRVALDARATRTRAEARRIGSNGTSAAPVVTPCVATLAARAAVAGGEATFSSLGRVSPTRRARARSIGGARGDGDGERAGENGGTRGRRGGRRGKNVGAVVGGGGAVGGDGASAREHPRVRVATRISERHSTAWPSRARVVPASSRARRVRRLESINGGGGDGGHVRARRGEWFSERHSTAGASVSSPISRTTRSSLATAAAPTSAPVAGSPARRRVAPNARRYELLVRQQMAAMRHQDMGQGIGQGMGQGMGWSATAGEERMFAPPEAHVAGDARGGGEETRGNRGGRGGGETREARLGRRARGWSGEARTCSACR